jgi:nucleoside-diphosphate-sugar epimerase
MKLQHVYGPKDDESKFIPWFLKQLKDEVPEIKLTAGTQKRDFIHVFDIVSAYILLLDKSDGFSKFEEFEVGTGSSIRVRDFLNEIVIAFEEKQGKHIKTRLNFGAIPMRMGEPVEIHANNLDLKLLGWDIIDKGLNFHFE